MAVLFPGDTTYFERADADLIPDGKQGTVSVYVKMLGGDGTDMYIMANNTVTPSFQVARTSLNRFVVIGRNAADTIILSIQSTAALSFVAGLHYHLYASWDLAAATAELTINGVDRLDPTQTLTDDLIAYSNGTWQVGAFEGADTWDGIIEEPYFDDSAINDVSKFLGPQGEAIGLGSKGTRPTGSRPRILLPHGPGNFGRNEGLGGNFSAVGATSFIAGRPAAVETLSRGFRGEEWRESERSGFPFPESELVFEPASGLEVARREFSTDRDQVNRRRRAGTTIFEG